MQNLLNLSNIQSVGKVTKSTSVAPKIYSLLFDGSNDIVTVADSDILDQLSAAGAFTAETFIRVVSKNLNGVEGIIRKGDTFNLRIDGIPKGYINTSAGNAEVNTGTMPQQRWVHYAEVWDGTTFSLFLNGVRLGTAARAGTLNTDSNDVKIGNGGGEAFPGYISQIRLSKVARYSGATYTKPTAQFVKDANTVALYPMTAEGGVGTTLIDASGNGLNGIFGSSTAAPVWSEDNPFDPLPLIEDYFTTDTIGNYTVVNGTWAVAGGVLQNTAGNGNDWANRLLLNKVINIEDFELTCKFVMRAANTMIVFRSGSTIGYGLQLRTDSGGQIRFEVWGSANLGSVQKTLNADSTYKIRLRAQGTALKAKVWLDGTTEPVGWDLEITDGGYTAGFIGLSGESGGAVTFTFDDLVVNQLIS